MHLGLVNASAKELNEGPLWVTSSDAFQSFIGKAGNGNNDVILHMVHPRNAEYGVGAGANEHAFESFETIYGTSSAPPGSTDARTGTDKKQDKSGHSKKQGAGALGADDLDHYAMLELTRTASARDINNVSIA